MRRADRELTDIADIKRIVAEAKVLQMISFVAPVLDDIEDEEKKAELSARVEEAIRSII